MSAGGGQAGGAGQRHSCRGVGLCCWARDSFTGRGLAPQDRSSTRVRPALAPCGRQLPGTRPGRAAPSVKCSFSDSAAPRFTPGSRMTVLKEFILTSMYFYLRGKLWITISPDLNLVSARVRPPHSEDRARHQRLDVPQLQVPVSPALRTARAPAAHTPADGQQGPRARTRLPASYFLHFYLDR